jgi:hypothetical protein
MVINFKHQEHSCSAYTVYEPSHVKNTIVVYMLDLNSELGYEVIFFKKEKNNWDTTAGLKINHPATYQALCKKLGEVFPGNLFVSRLESGESNELKSRVA